MKQAVCLLCRRSDGKILAVSRRGQPDQFGLPGGKVDPGETSVEAIIREVREETGLIITNPQQIFELTCEGEVDYWSKVYYSADIDTTAPLYTDEPVQPKWVEPQVLLDGPFGKFNQQLFDKVGISC